MAITLGINIQSLRTQRSLSDATGRVGSSLERLASGMRINRASDDAAGLAVASSLNADSRFFSTSSRNINDGISMLNIVDSTISSQTGILGRMLELAEQSANGTYSTAQRSSLQNEYLALQKEFGRLADTATFNGLKLLRSDRSDGVSTISLQAGITGNSNSILSVRTGDTSNLSGIFNIRTIRGGGNSNADGTIDAGDFDSIALGKADPSSASGAVFYSQVRGSDGRMYDIAIAAVDYSDDGSFGSDYTNSGQVAVSFAVYYKKSDGSWDYASVQHAQLGGSNDFAVTFNESTGQAISSTVSSNSQISTSITMGGASGTLNLDFSGLKFFANNNESQQTATDLTGIENVNRAKDSLTVVRNRFNELNSLRGTFGAMMSRLLVASQISFTSRENTTAAASRIMDADIASESGELTRQSILQKVATAVLAQANQAPQLALALIT